MRTAQVKNKTELILSKPQKWYYAYVNNNYLSTFLNHENRWKHDSIDYLKTTTYYILHNLLLLLFFFSFRIVFFLNVVLYENYIHCIGKTGSFGMTLWNVSIVCRIESDWRKLVFCFCWIFFYENQTWI